MNVVVIRRPREDARSKTGLGRYADSIECNLESAGEPFSVVEADITLNQGLFHCLQNGVFAPMGQVRRMCRGRDVTIHATDELCGVFFPLIRGRRILTIHHVVKDDEGRGRLYNAIWRIATRTSIRFADDIIAISPNTAEDVKLVFHPKASVQVVFNKPADYYHRDPSVSREMVVGVVAELIARKNVSESIEAFRILSTMDGMEDVKMKICGRGLEKDNLVRMVHNVGLDDRMDHRPNELSGGQRQRVALARALINSPSIILADEPTGNLDTHTSVEIMRLFDQIYRNGNTVIVVTHEEDIAAYAHRVIRLRDGRIESDTEHIK